MRRFVTLAVLLLFTIPFGVSISGCSRNKVAVTYCDGGDSGVAEGTLTTLTLQPRLTGISLNNGEIGQAGLPVGTDCKGNAASASPYYYGSSNTALVDVQPTTGKLCAGTWNRNTSTVADYTVCTPNTISGTAYITATAGGVTSNALPVYIHPVVTSIVLGAPSVDCTLDPASNCTLQTTGGCVPGPAGATNSGFPAYTESACVSQGNIVQLAARAYTGTNTSLASNNISCLVGPLTYTPGASTLVSINQNGQATALQPGSTIVNAATSNSSSTAGFFSTCPPASITLSLPGVSGTANTVQQNTAQQITASIVDTAGNPLTNLNLTFISTEPTNIPATSSSITPVFPGTAAITALCEPPGCNPSPFNQIGLFGNGLTVTSNPIDITTPGTNSSVLYVASTGSQYIIPIDFTNNNLGSPVRLPYAPNSMVLSEDQSTIYMGTANELMILSAATGTLTKEDNTVSGTVLSVSPNNSSVIVTDPVRQLVYIYNSTGGVTAQYGGVATSAAWTADSTTVYITTAANQLLTYSTFTGWNLTNLSPSTNLATDVAVTVPNSGIFLAGTPYMTARTDCPTTTVNGSGINTTTTNVFYPLANTTSAAANRIVTTNDGQHVFGATTANFADVKVTVPRGACPAPGQPTPSFAPQTITNPPFTKLTATSINRILATTDSAYGFVIYTGTGGVVPQYNPATATLTYVPLLGSATAPVSGVLSSDNNTLFVGTSGDNLVHILTRGATGFTDTTQTTGIPYPLNPQLPSITGTGYATPNLLAQRPRKLTN